MSDYSPVERVEAFLLGSIRWGGSLVLGALLGAVVFTATWFGMHVWTYGDSTEWWGEWLGPPAGLVIGATWYGLLRGFLSISLPILDRQDQRNHQRFPDRRFPSDLTLTPRIGIGVLLAVVMLLGLCAIPLGLMGFRIPPPPQVFGFSDRVFIPRVE